MATDRIDYDEIPDEKDPLITSPAVEISEDRRVIYINLLILDATNVIDQRLSEHFDQTKLRYLPVAKAAATKVANTIMTPSRIAQILSLRLPAKVTERMEAQGITAVVECIFREGPYVVVQLQIKSVCTKSLLEARSQDLYTPDGKLERAASFDADCSSQLQQCLTQFWNLIGLQHQRAVEEDVLPQLIQSKMEGMLTDIVADKLEQQGLQAVAEVLPQEEQARFFFKTLKDVRQAQREQSAVVRVKAVASNVQEKASQVKAGVQEKASLVKSGVQEKASLVKGKANQVKAGVQVKANQVKAGVQERATLVKAGVQEKANQVKAEVQNKAVKVRAKFGQTLLGLNNNRNKLQQQQSPTQEQQPTEPQEPSTPTQAQEEEEPSEAETTAAAIV